jgi:L-2-hydroxyglutarate oxidase
MIAGWDFLSLALAELRLSISKRAFVQAAKELIPEISEEDLVRDQSGIRAQLVDRRGNFVEDFVFESTDKSFHVLNAVSPGLTCALPFAGYIADMIVGERQSHR